MIGQGFDILTNGGNLPERFVPPHFKARLPWIGGDLQTLKNNLFSPPANFLLKEEKTISFPIGQGEHLIGKLNEPKGSPLNKTIFLLHGLGGSSESIYMTCAADYFISLGWRVIRLNMRGSGPSQMTSFGQCHAGLTGDIKDLLQNLPAELTSDRIYFMGFSLGGNMILKFLGEGENCDLIQKAVAISAPLDLKTTVETLQRVRNKPYLAYLLGKLKSDFRGADWGSYDWGHKDIENIKSIFEYDDQIIAPYHGFDSALDYYKKSSAESYLSMIDKETLIIFAKNDPWIPAHVYKNITWKGFKTITSLILNDGGHLGFHGTDSLVPWHLRAAESYLNY